MAAQAATEIDLPVELEGFVADVNINFQFGEKVRRAVCLDNIAAYVRFDGSRVYLEGNFDLADLAAIMYFLDEGE